MGKDKKSEDIKTKKKKDSLETLKKDLKKLTKDWERLIEEKKLATDSSFLKEMADDITNIEEDLSEFQSSHTAKQIHKLLAAPWHAPFLEKETLLDAALSFKYQDPLDSDLCHIMNDVTRYEKEFEGEYLPIYWSLYQTLSSKD